MGLIDIASGKSIWRGMDYYERMMVSSWKKISDTEYEGTVSGSENNEYQVHIDLEHPRKSKCNCPFAEGRRVICKHMVALYFTAAPGTAEKFLKQVEEWEKEEEEEFEARLSGIRDYVDSLPEVEARRMLYDLLAQEEERRYW